MVLNLKATNITDSMIIVNQIDPQSIHITYSFVVSNFAPELSNLSSEIPSYNSFLFPIKSNPESTYGQSSLYNNDLDEIDNTIHYIYDQKSKNGLLDSKPIITVTQLDAKSKYLYCANKLETLSNFIDFVDYEFGIEYRSKYEPDLIYSIKKIGIRFGYKQEFLFYPIRELKAAQRVYLAYTVYNNEGLVWLPTCINDNKTLKIPRKVKRDCTILWGGSNPKHDGCIAMNPKPKTTHYSPCPEYIYGITDFESIDPSPVHQNGYIGIDMNNSDINNLIINHNSSAFQHHSIF
jgi:hypothetical protein